MKVNFSKITALIGYLLLVVSVMPSISPEVSQMLQQIAIALGAVPVTLATRAELLQPDAPDPSDLSPQAKMKRKPKTGGSVIGGILRRLLLSK